MLNPTRWLFGVLTVAGMTLMGCDSEGTAQPSLNRPVIAESTTVTGASESPARDGKWIRRLRDLKRRVDEAEPFFTDDFDREALGGEWIVEEGTWTTCRAPGLAQEGVIGTNGDNYPDSFLWTKRTIEGDVVIDVEAECLSDPPNDINLVMCGKSPNYPPPEGPLYLFGLGGWENTKTGIERAPDYKWKVLTSLFTLEPNKPYHIQAARIGDTFYLFVDDRLVIEARDLDPLPATGQVALHVFNSRVRFSKLRLRKP